MLRKIILPVVLLIFTQQQFYGMDVKNKNKEEKAQVSIWRTINNYVNIDKSCEKQGKYPKLWFLWAFFDNIPFQYGGSKIWKHGEAYYGLSNGIGFFPSFLNFGWLKIGIVDVHINVINAILDCFKCFLYDMTQLYPPLKTVERCKSIIKGLLLKNFLFFNIHIFSFKILNCIKIKIISLLCILFFKFLIQGGAEYIATLSWKNNISKAWYIKYDGEEKISGLYALLSPRIEINISGIINYFKR